MTAPRAGRRTGDLAHAPLTWLMPAGLANVPLTPLALDDGGAMTGLTAKHAIDLEDRARHRPGATRLARWPAGAESRVTIVVKVMVPRFGHKGVDRVRAHSTTTCTQLQTHYV